MMLFPRRSLPTRTACCSLVPWRKGTETVEHPSLFQGSKWPVWTEGAGQKEPEPVLTKGGKCLALLPLLGLVLTSRHSLPGLGCHPGVRRGH